MAKNKKSWLSYIPFKAWLALIVVAVVVIALLYCCGGAEVKETTETETQFSPTMLTSMEQIGEWEFLTVSDEELVDTTVKSIFGDKQLTRIYYGKLRLGIDMSEAGKDWVRAEGDSVSVTLPPVKLLDEKFIDEARTKSFFESGSWTEEDREALLHRAEAKMRERCLSRETMKSAEANATARVSQIFRALGYKKVRVRLGNGSSKD